MDDLVKKGLIKAVRDLKSAEQLLQVSKNDLYSDTICFNSQQAAEKFLKSYLSSKNLSFPRTHNLKFLQHLCVKSDADFKNIDVGGLTIYAVSVRYPESYHIPTLEEAEKAFLTAVKIKNFVLGKFNTDESELKLF
jgi:HEPN domain-containing protein